MTKESSDLDLSVRVLCECEEGTGPLPWQEFLDIYGAHIIGVDVVQFIADFRGSTRGWRRKAIDAHLRRILSAHGLRLDRLVGVFSSRAAEEM